MKEDKKETLLDLHSNWLCGNGEEERWTATGRIFWIIPERKEGIWLCGIRDSGFECIREENDSGRILYDGDEAKDMGEGSAEDTIIQIV